MTWTLRLYDSDGNEVAYAQLTDAGDYSVTMVQSKDDWGDVYLSLLSSDEVYADELDGYSFESVDLPDGRSNPQPSAISFPPKDHLTVVKDEMLRYPCIESATVADE
jgi:hypothetical protein